MSDPYVLAVLAAYHALPCTPRRASRHDRLLARSLASRGIPLETVEVAFVVATARRTFRPEDSVPLGPIRSLAYFLPALEEVLARPLDPEYLSYLNRRLDRPAPKLSL